MNSVVRWLLVGSPLAALFVGVGLAQLTNSAPPSDDDTFVIAASLLLACALHIFLFTYWRNARLKSLERFARASLAALLASLFCYGLLLFAFSVRRDDNWRVRVPLGLIYTADFRSYQTDHPETTAAAWVAGGDRPELVYTAWSLQFVKLAFALLWLVVALSLTLFVSCTALVFLRRGALLDPQLAALRERMEAWPEPVPLEMRASLEAALRTLVENGNKHGAILTVAPLFEGRDGFLGAVATAAGTRLERSLWADQIEELRTAGHLPPHIASELHTVRVYSNDARHNKRRLSFDDARRTLEAAARAFEWYLYEFPRGPLFPRPDASITLPPNSNLTPPT